MIAYIFQSSQLPVYLLQLLGHLLHTFLNVFEFPQFSFFLWAVLFRDYHQCFANAHIQAPEM